MILTAWSFGLGVCDLKTFFKFGAISFQTGDQRHEERRRQLHVPDAAVVAVVAGIPEELDVLHLVGRVLQRIGSPLAFAPPVIDPQTQIQLSGSSSTGGYSFYSFPSYLIGGL